MLFSDLIPSPVFVESFNFPLAERLFVDVLFSPEPPGVGPVFGSRVGPMVRVIAVE
jgi:hypothetical protein